MITTSLPSSMLSTHAQKQDSNQVTVQISLLGFDPIRGELDSRLWILPSGSYIDRESGFLSKDMRLIDLNSTTNQEILFKREKQIPSLVSRYAIFEGDVNSYPFDRHTTEIELYIEESQISSPNTAISLDYEFFEELPGFKVAAKDTQEADEEFISLEVSITRSVPVILFSIVVMLIMWLLSVTSLLMALSIQRSTKMPETSALGFMGALLFAFPAIRNAQPHVPPVGTLGDFLSFFWAEVIVVVAICICGYCWISRYTKSEK